MAAKHECPVCNYSTQRSENLEAHKRNLKHDGQQRKQSRAGLTTLGRAGKKRSK